jgi:CubicO group peptidase (beta-lactamase class C family)
MTTIRRTGTALTLLALAALLAPAGPAGAQPAPLDGLDAYVEETMEAWGVPGLALAVVKDGSVVYARGYGVRNAERGDPVDEHTVFAIGSSSKAFTTASLAMLVDDGELSWDDPATRHLPELRLHGAYPTHELTVRDLVTHRSGLPRCDRLWYATSFDRDEVLRRVRFCEPSWSFRSHFGYQNIMFLAAGMIVSEVSGTRWDAFVERRIFDPLDMERSSTSVDSLDGTSNVASPHGEIDGEVRPVPWRNIDNVGPAGSINSSVAEMARWVRLHLGEGVFRGDTLISPESVEEMHSPHMLVDSDSPLRRLLGARGHFAAYGMGWFLHDYEGVKIVEHGGAIDGMRAQVGMVPEEDLGMVILTNRGGSSPVSALMYRVVDAYLDLPETDWSERFKSVSDSIEAEGEEQDQELREARKEGTSPSVDLAAYAGTYTDSLYGDLEVTEDDGRLSLSYHSMTADLEHWHLDTFRADWDDPLAGQQSRAASLLTFGLDASARVTSVEVPGMGEFERRPERDGESGEE